LDSRRLRRVQDVVVEKTPERGRCKVQVVDAGTQVFLDGSASSEANGEGLLIPAKQIQKTQASREVSLHQVVPWP
jgi:hypothetical protein